MPPPRIYYFALFFAIYWSLHRIWDIPFSQLIMLIAEITNLAVILFSCVMIWRTNDTSALSYLIPSVAAEVATGTGFYYNKAKTENTIKLKKEAGLPPDSGDFDSTE